VSDTRHKLPKVLGKDVKKTMRQLETGCQEAARDPTAGSVVVKNEIAQLV
jgi:hypothetical protein